MAMGKWPDGLALQEQEPEQPAADELSATEGLQVEAGALGRELAHSQVSCRAGL